jgi:Flp pilus assembly protein TadG
MTIRRSIDWRDDRGSVTIMIAVLGLSFLMAAGLAIDGARKLGGLSEARDLADNAARSCAQAVDNIAYRSTGVPLLNPTNAAVRADAYLASTGNTGTATVAETECTVTVTLTISTQFLPGPYVVSATESAQALSGVEGATP